jgi:hypothetical protein
MYRYRSAIEALNACGVAGNERAREIEQFCEMPSPAFQSWLQIARDMGRRATKEVLRKN